MDPKDIQGQSMNKLLNPFRFQRGLAFGVIIIAALLAFEIFNYSTTEYALSDLLGDLTFLGVHWSTILALAFCGIDFAGIARLFTPEEGADEPGEVWYLFGAWLLAATMNAMLTWWGISLAILNTETLGSAVIERGTLLRVVPIFVAVLVWLIRVLIIGTFSVAGDRLFSQSDQRVRIQQAQRPYRVPASTPPAPVRSLGSRAQAPRAVSATSSGTTGAFRPAPKPVEQPEPAPSFSRPEPTYHPVSMSPNQNSTGKGTNGDKALSNNVISSRRGPQSRS
jgi:hypothetical protein